VLLDVDDARTFAGTMLGSHLLGLIVGDRLIDGKDFSRSDATRVALFTLGGALAGLGIVALTNPEDNPEDSYAAGVSIGLSAGYVGGALFTNARPEGSVTKTGPVVNAVPIMMQNRGIGVGLSLTAW
jgi:hypothetical protein